MITRLVADVPQAHKFGQIIFHRIARYLRDRDLQRETTGALNVVENFNGVNDYIHFGKGGEFSSNRREEQELSMLCLHILQSSLAFVNTLMIQDVLAEPEWDGVLGDADRRGLTPLFHSNMSPYGSLPGLAVLLTMNARSLETAHVGHGRRPRGRGLGQLDDQATGRLRWHFGPPRRGHAPLLASFEPEASTRLARTKGGTITVADVGQRDVMQHASWLENYGRFEIDMSTHLDVLQQPPAIDRSPVGVS